MPLKKHNGILDYMFNLHGLLLVDPIAMMPPEMEACIRLKFTTFCILWIVTKIR